MSRHHYGLAGQRRTPANANDPATAKLCAVHGTAGNLTLPPVAPYTIRIGCGVKIYEVAVEQLAEEDPSVETYPVQIEEDYVVLYI